MMFHSEHLYNIGIPNTSKLMNIGSNFRSDKYINKYKQPIYLLGFFFTYLTR